MYNAQGDVIRSIDLTGQKEYTYEYEIEVFEI